MNNEVAKSMTIDTEARLRDSDSGTFSSEVLLEAFGCTKPPTRQWVVSCKKKDWWGFVRALQVNG